ncbi:MAG: phosphate ABC transporter permease subunit PstC [Anaerolineae bacterium]|nr:phosphate ABC transporter permease subunit PstC [Anaerolineae bacterium]
MAVANPARNATISGKQRGDEVFQWVVRLSSLVSLLVLAALLAVLINYSSTALSRFGFGFITGTTWDPANAEVFGAAPYIVGTVITSAIALILATPFAIGAALFVAEYAPRWLGGPVAFTVELLVTIPSVVYGLWGIFVLAPFMRRTVEPFLKATLGPVPVIGGLFTGPATGKDMLTAGVILAIMILPTILSISREIITQVPRLQKEGMLALGATKWETLRFAILPYAKAGIVGAAMLGLARAIGETMAVTMLIGNASGGISGSLLSASATIASTIANQYGDTNSPLHFSAVLALGLVLLVIASAFNMAARLFVRRVTRLPGGGRV